MFPNPVCPLLGPVAIPLNSIFPILPLSVELQHSTDLHPSHGDSGSPLAERRKGIETFRSQGKHGGSGQPSASPGGDAKADRSLLPATQTHGKGGLLSSAQGEWALRKRLCAAGFPRLPTHLLNFQALQGTQ